MMLLCITVKYTNVNSFASWAAVSTNNEEYKKLICEYDILCWKCRNYDIQKTKLNINDDDDDDDDMLMQSTTMYMHMGGITILEYYHSLGLIKYTTTYAT